MKGDQALLTLAANVDTAGKKIASAQGPTRNLTDSFVRASTSSSKFAGDIGQTATKMALLGSSMGMPVEGLRALAAAEGLATVGMRGLTTATKGFWLAALGPIAAVGALAAALGTLLGRLGPVREFADNAAAALLRLFTAQENLDRQALGNMPQADFEARIAPRHEGARREQIAGMNAEQAKAHLLGEKRLTIEQRIVKELEEQEKAQRRAAAAAGKTAEATQSILDAMRGAVSAGNPFVKIFGDARTEAEKLRDVFGDLPTGVSSLSPEGPNPFDPGAAPPPPDVGIKWGDAFKDGFEGALTDLPNVILGAIQGGGDVGGSIGAHMGGSIGQNLSKPIGDALGKVLGGTIGGAVGSVVPVVGTLVGGAIGSAIGGLFGGGEGAKVNDLRDQFIEAAGGLDELRLRAHEAGMTLDALLAADKVHEFETAVRQLNGAMSEHDQWIKLQADSHRALEDAVQRYGFSIEELGPKFQQQRLDEMALQLLQDFQLLTASGIDQAVVLERMGPAFSEYVQAAIASGAPLTESLRGPVEALIASGQLLDANGEAYESAAAAGITFAETQTEAFSRMADEIERLVNALLGIKPVPDPLAGWSPPGDFPIPGSPYPIPAASGFGPMVVPNVGGGLGPLIQTHPGELVGVWPASMVRGHARASKTPFFFGAAEGFGKREPRERDRGAGGGGGLSDGTTTSDGAASGTSSTHPAQAAAAAAEETKDAVRELKEIVKQLAERPSADVTLAPTINAQMDPTQTLQGQQDMIRITTRGIVKALQDLEPELVDAVRFAAGR